MSPTVFRAAGMRFFFFSREEQRRHVHVIAPEGEAKIWLEPRIEVARSHGLSERRLRRAVAIVERRADEVRRAWDEHFDT